MPNNDPAGYLPSVKKARLKRFSGKLAAADNTRVASQKPAEPKPKPKGAIDRFMHKINNPEPGSSRARAEADRIANPAGKKVFEKLKKLREKRGG